MSLRPAKTYRPATHDILYPRKELLSYEPVRSSDTRARLSYPAASQKSDGHEYRPRRYSSPSQRPVSWQYQMSQPGPSNRHTTSSHTVSDRERTSGRSKHSKPIIHQTSSSAQDLRHPEQSRRRNSLSEHPIINHETQVRNTSGRDDLPEQAHRRPRRYEHTSSNPPNPPHVDERVRHYTSSSKASQSNQRHNIQVLQPSRSSGNHTPRRSERLRYNETNTLKPAIINDDRHVNALKPTRSAEKRRLSQVENHGEDSRSTSKLRPLEKHVHWARNLVE